MTKEQHDKLKKYEGVFRSAIDSLYIRAMDSRFAADLINTCRELCIHVNPSCPACMLKATQTLGKLYFEFREPEPPADADKPDKSEKPKVAKKPVVTRSQKPKKTNKK